MTTASDRFTAGTPCRVSLMARELDVATDFYGPLFGWTFEPVPTGSGRQVRALRDGFDVAGISDTARRWDQLVAWTIYFSTDDADKTAAAIRERGATVGVGPLECGTGRIALASDPFGASFGLWEGPAPAGPPPVTGRADWLQLRSRDAFDSALFYGGVFRWDDPPEPERLDVVWEHDRVVLRVDGRAAAALAGGGTQDAPDPRVRPRWHVYFSVDDVDAALDRARSLGGEVTGEPENSAYGRVAGLRDPEGGLLSLITRD